MKSEKIKQFSASILVVLSLFVSSISACCCAHHQEKVETEVPSCHAQAHETEENTDSANADDKDFINAPCECFMESAMKVFAKSENIKIEKQTAKISNLIHFEIKQVLHIVSGVKIEFSTPLYLSDLILNPKSPRAPPTV